MQTLAQVIQARVNVTWAPGVPPYSHGLAPTPPGIGGCSLILSRLKPGPLGPESFQMCVVVPPWYCLPLSDTSRGPRPRWSAEPAASAAGLLMQLDHFLLASRRSAHGREGDEDLQLDPAPLGQPLALTARCSDCQLHCAGLAADPCCHASPGQPQDPFCRDSNGQCRNAATPVELWPAHLENAMAGARLRGRAGVVGRCDPALVVADRARRERVRRGPVTSTRSWLHW